MPEGLEGSGPLMQPQGYGIPPGVAMGPQLVKRGQALFSVFVPCPGIAPPNRLGFCLYVPRKLRHKTLQINHGPIPFLTFSMASRPNSRCASWDRVLSHCRTVRSV
jgi:hypothetical protein